MATPETLKARFWKALKSDMTVMLGLSGRADGHLRPMTAQFEDSAGPIWFFTSKDNGIAEALAAGAPGAGVGSFVSKGHDLFASFDGTIAIDSDPATIDRLWNPFVAAWYKGGKTDPNLVLLRMEPRDAMIWVNENSVFAGLKLLLGIDPKADYKDKVAQVSLG